MFKLNAPVNRPDLLGDAKDSQSQLHSKPTRDSAKSSVGTVTYAVLQDSQCQERTDLHGNPIKFEDDPHARYQLLPPGYTDDSVVYIPIRGSCFEEAPANQVNLMPPALEKKRSFFRRLSGSGKREEDAVRIVPMTRGDYLRYWAKGADGKFLASVIDPPQGRAAWLRDHMEKDWVKEDESRMRTKHDKYKHEGWIDLGEGGGGDG